MSKNRPGNNNMRYEVVTHADSKTDDVILPIPLVLLKQLGWKEGDDVELITDAQGHLVLKRIEK
jgi:hypothetical protein